jgi:hypothetical protein
VFIRDCEVALGFLHRRPSGREAFEGHAAEQQRIAREELFGLILRELVVEVLV